MAGEVLETRTVTVPSKPYAADEEHLILVDTGKRVARILHVDPAVAAGETVAVGDSLGRLVRAGFFAPWVANHLHLGFREYGTDSYRAAGSLPLEVDPDLGVDAVEWDGTRTVVAAGETYAILDSPTRPAPGERFAGLAATDAWGGPIGVLDGGLPHYDGGGLMHRRPGSGANGVFLVGERVSRADGYDVAWSDVTVRANGDPITGIALALSRDRTGAKLVGESVDLPVGTEVSVEIEPGSP